MGSECFYMRAQKDMTRHVENNDSIWVDNNQNIYVHNLRQVIVDKGSEAIILHNGDRSIKIDMGSQTTEAMQSITLKVGQAALCSTRRG